MNLCNENHPEICYEGHICPLCATKDELQTEIDDLKEINEELSAEVKTLEYDLQQAQNE
jgi:FtsZ-binding cell division protein ZapB